MNNSLFLAFHLFLFLFLHPYSSLFSFFFLFFPFYPFLPPIFYLPLFFVIFLAIFPSSLSVVYVAVLLQPHSCKVTATVGRT